MRNKIRNGISHCFSAILPQKTCVSHSYFNRFSLALALFSQFFLFFIAFLIHYPCISFLTLPDSMFFFSLAFSPVNPSAFCRFPANSLLTFCQLSVDSLSTPYQLPVFYSLFLCRSPVVSMFLINHCYVFLQPSVLFHSSKQLCSLECLSLCTRVNKPVYWSATIEMLIEKHAYVVLYHLDNCLIMCN